MIIRYYSIYDEVAKKYMPLFQSINDETAVRDLAPSVCSHKFYEIKDKKLYFVLSFDDSTGAVVESKPVLIKNLLEIRDFFKEESPDVSKN